MRAAGCLSIKPSTAMGSRICSDEGAPHRARDGITLSGLKITTSAEAEQTPRPPIRGLGAAGEIVSLFFTLCQRHAPQIRRCLRPHCWPIRGNVAEGVIVQAALV